MIDNEELETLDEALLYLNEGVIKDIKKYTEAEKDLKEKAKKVFDAMRRRAVDASVDIKFKFASPDTKTKSVTALMGANGTLASAAFAGVAVATMHPIEGISTISAASKEDTDTAWRFKDFERKEDLINTMKGKYDFVKDIKYTNLKYITIYMK